MVIQDQGADEELDPDLVVSLINSFGTFMQCLVPLFETTLFITDSDFTGVAGHTAAAAFSLAAVLGSIFAAPVAGPLALIAAFTSVGFGGVLGYTAVGAIHQGIEWGRKRDLDRE
jgi:hypothetical protein